MTSQSKFTWVGIAVLVAAGAFWVLRLFFPEIIEQIAAGIVVFFAFLLSLIFRKKKS